MVTVAAEALMKLETRAVAAEKLIQLLRSQIKACKVRSFQNTSYDNGYKGGGGRNDISS